MIFFEVPSESGDFSLLVRSGGEALRSPQAPSSATNSSLLLPMHCACHDRYFKSDQSYLHTKYYMPLPESFDYISVANIFSLSAGG